MSDNIALHKSDCALLLGGYQCTCGFHQRNSKTLPALAAEQPKHPGYIIGSHWLETAYSRICAGEAEADVLRDCGWERVDDIDALRRDAERLREALEKVVAADDDLNDELTYICGRLLEEIKAALRREDTP